MNQRWPARGLYAITPDDPDTPRLLSRAAAALDGGAAWLQYRNKAAAAELRAAQAAALQPLCARYRVPLIINDDWRLAARLGADGAHIGADDGDLAAARELMGPDALIGASCYDSVALARLAVGAGASYVAFGAFFPSPTKPHARRASPSLLGEAATLGVPRVAIGGINLDNAPDLVAAGADLLAVISAVFDAADPARAARAFAACYGTKPPPHSPSRLRDPE
jgi:thiamine-phosphate pyrophosphorylase